MKNNNFLVATKFNDKSQKFIYSPEHVLKVTHILSHTHLNTFRLSTKKN